MRARGRKVSAARVGRSMCTRVWGRRACAAGRLQEGMGGHLCRGEHGQVGFGHESMSRTAWETRLGHESVAMRAWAG
eukprot:86396-Chlamydomonas_euryale.AAC.8